MPLRLIFMGTPQFAMPTLLELVGHGHEIAAVYTRAPKPAGRGMKLQPTPVEQEARRLGIAVLTPTTLKRPEALDEFRAHKADAAVVVAYGMILPEPILNTPPLGCFNLHASLLPRWRGAAPIQRAIMAGDTETGIMVMRMDEGLDTGPIALAERIPIGPDATAGELHDELSQLGADLITRTLAALGRDSLRFQPQPEDGVTYAHKISKDECRIAWSRPTQEVHDHIRGLSPAPGAFFDADFGRGIERIKVLRSSIIQADGPPGTIIDDQLTIACGSGAVRLLNVQRAGKAPMDAASFFRGARTPAGALRN
jgi:methionyl-tRNA formyltransferase